VAQFASCCRCGRVNAPGKMTCLCTQAPDEWKSPGGPGREIATNISQLEPAERETLRLLTTASDDLSSLDIGMCIGRVLSRLNDATYRNRIVRLLGPGVVARGVAALIRLRATQLDSWRRRDTSATVRHVLDRTRGPTASRAFGRSTSSSRRQELAWLTTHGASADIYLQPQNGRFSSLAMGDSEVSMEDALEVWFAAETTTRTLDEQHSRRKKPWAVDGTGPYQLVGRTDQWGPTDDPDWPECSHRPDDLVHVGPPPLRGGLCGTCYVHEHRHKELPAPAELRRTLLNRKWSPGAP